MQKSDVQEKEKGWLFALAQVEDLGEKKTKIYSRLLTEVAIAQAMEELSARHAKRKKKLEALALGKTETKSGGEEE